MESLKILQLTDFHLFGQKDHWIMGLNPYSTLEKIMAMVTIDIANQKPDLVLLTGDLSQDNSLKSYEFIREMCRIFPCPITATMGNHDIPEHFQKVFGAASQKYYSFPKWRVIALNSYWPEHVSGQLSADEIKFLEAALVQDEDKATIIVLHHHVLPVKCAWLDNIGLNNSELFLKIIDQYKNIKIVLCGHVHQENILHHNEVDFITTPSTSWQFAKATSNFQLDTLMPGYRWIELFPDGTYQTQVKRLEFNCGLVPDLNSGGY